MTAGLSEWDYYWRNVLVDECRKRDPRAFTGKNKLRYAMHLNLGSATPGVYLTNGVMLLVDTSREKVVLAAFPAWTDPTRLARTDAEREDLDARGESAAKANNVEIKELPGLTGGNEIVYMRELAVAEADFLVGDGYGTFTAAGEEQISLFGQAVLAAASAFLDDDGDSDALFAHFEAFEQAFKNRMAQEGIELGDQNDPGPVAAKPLSTPVSQPSKQVASAGSSGWCYVATADYGSSDAPQVRSLLRFRDERLAKSAIGRAFVRLYYKVSPPMAEYLEGATRLNRLTRHALDAVVRKIESQGNTPGPYQG